MKKCVSYILLSLVAGVYILSTMGYGIHECMHDGTKNVIVLFGETPCEYVHSHIDAQGHVYTHSHAIGEDNTGCHCAGAKGGHYMHSGKCCKTTVFALSHDQVNSQNPVPETPPTVLDLSIIPNESLLLNGISSANVVEALYPDSCRWWPLSPLHIIISQFRV